MGGVDGATEGGLVEASGGVPAVNLRSGVDAALLDKPPRPAGVGLRLTRGGMSDCDEGSEGHRGGDPSSPLGGPPLSPPLSWLQPPPPASLHAHAHGVCRRSGHGYRRLEPRYRARRRHEAPPRRHDAPPPARTEEAARTARERPASAWQPAALRSGWTGRLRRRASSTCRSCSIRAATSRSRTCSHPFAFASWLEPYPLASHSPIGAFSTRLPCTASRSTRSTIERRGAGAA